MQGRALAAAMTVLLGLAGPANAASWAPRFEGTFTTQGPGQATGFHEEIDYFDAANPGAKPYAVERILIDLADGTNIDTTVPAQCKASPAELTLLGAAACPAASRIGGGSVDIDTGSQVPGVPRIVESQVTLFNDQDAIVLFTETQNTHAPIRNAGRVVAKDGQFVNDAPALPGFPPPESYSAIRRVRLDIDNVTSPDGTRPYLTTPPSCPSIGSWTTTGIFTFRDASVHAVDSSSVCVAG